MLTFPLTFVAALLYVQNAPVPSPDAALISVANQWQDAWNKHDMEALGEVVAEDVDFVTVGGRWLKGREAFKAYHAERHATNFSKSTFEVRRTHVQRLKPDMVLLHVEWTIKGDTNQDGTARPASRDGIFTWVLSQSDGRWRIRVAHNTNLQTPVPAAR